MKETGNWFEYSDNKISLDKDCLSREIVNELGTLTDIILSKESKKTLTKKVKRTLIDLAHSEKNKCKAYANGFTKEEVKAIGNGFVNKEWLYDVHFYTDVVGQDFMPELFLLACECEWSKHKSKNWDQNFKDIGYDFQKLLFCNSLLRLLICRVNKTDELLKLQNYFNSAISNFKQLEDGARFIFVAYCWETGNMYYQEIIKGRH